MRTDEKNDDVSLLHILLYFVRNILAGKNVGIRPVGNYTALLHESQRMLKLLTMSSILVGVAVEQPDRESR